MLRVASLLLLLATIPVSAQKGSNMPFSLQSSAFKDGAEIPKQYTCDGADGSPALSWSGAPEKTQTFALIADDPDAPVGDWVHWVAWDIPASVAQFPENLPKAADLPGGGHQGANDFKKTGYGGPCPPPGKPHRYFFKLYALDSKLDLRPGATKKDVEQAMKGHVLGQAELMGRYQRNR